MMRKFLSAAALTALCAMPSFAATLNGTFTIDIRNFSDGDSEPFDVEQANSTATAANFNALTSDAVITYTGNLAFNLPAGNNSTTYISTFLANGGGVISDASAVELGFLAGTLLSQATYLTTTFFKITGTLASAVTGTITHDDGITLVLYCPDRGDYGSKFAKLFGRELNRTVEFIPIDFDRLIQAIDTQNYPTLIDCDSEFKFQCPRTWQSFELTNKSNVMKAIVIVRSNCGSYSPAWLLPRSLFKSYKNDSHTASSA